MPALGRVGGGSQLDGVSSTAEATRWDHTRTGASATGGSNSLSRRAAVTLAASITDVVELREVLAMCGLLETGARATA